MSPLRYGRPLLPAEINVRGFPSDRATWLRLMLDAAALNAHDRDVLPALQRRSVA